MAVNGRSDGSAPGHATGSWRTADIGAPVLLGGLLLLTAATLGLASLGSAVGVAAMAVLLAGVIGLLWFWGREQQRSSSSAHQRGPEPAADQPHADQPGSNQPEANQPESN